MSGDFSSIWLELKRERERDIFMRDAGRLWNRAPDRIKMAPSIVSAKAEIRKYCKTVPI